MNRAMDKYRVWDEEKKEYVSSRVFINHHGETCLIKTGCFYPHKVTKEHCTGLKDKNGKLIYEGDCFVHPRFETLHKDSRAVYVVEYDCDSMAGYDWFNGDGCGFDVSSGIANVYVVGNKREIYDDAAAKNNKWNKWRRGEIDLTKEDIDK